MHKQHSTTVTNTVEGKQCMVHASDQRFPQWLVHNAWYTRLTENFLVSKHSSINQSRPTGTLCADVYNQKSEWRMENTNALFPRRRLWTSRHEARLQLRIFSYESITSRNHTIALNATVSWKVGKGLMEIQQAGIIILMLAFSFQLTLRDNIGTDEIHVHYIESIWFCPVEFNSTYPANKKGIFSSRALDTFGSIWLIQVSSIATYGNKRLPQSDRVVLVLK